MVAALSETDFAFLQRLALERCGFVLEPDKRCIVEARLSPVVSRYGLGSVAALMSQVRADDACGALSRDAVEAIINGETAFFRDGPCWQAIEHLVLPALVEARGAERRLRIWSAACSTGQEPYSLAMLAKCALPSLAGWDVSILATDVSQVHLERARRGRYSQLEVSRGLSAYYLMECFEQDEGDWVVREDVKRRVELRELNLVQPWPLLPPMDLILMRNVMLYWDTETKRAVLDRVARLLRPGGVLVLGGAESTFYLTDRFDRCDALSPCCFRARSSAGR